MFIHKILWIVLNALNNLQFPIFVKNLSVSTYSPGPVLDATFKLGRLSPSRLLCNLFWESINFQEIRNFLGEPLNVIDLGCGDGDYSNKLDLLKSETYCGVDFRQHPNWYSLTSCTSVVSPNISFTIADYLEITEYIQDKNLLITQSALEHFELDILLFEKINSHILKTGRPFVQIHLMPASSTFFLNLYHGIRQYNLRSIKKLISASTSSSQSMIYALGGKQVNKFHFSCITLPQLFNHQTFFHHLGYESELVRLATQPPDNVNFKDTNFYALVIFHNSTLNVSPISFLNN
jgi:hypothetical protein